MRMLRTVNKFHGVPKGGQLSNPEFVRKYILPAGQALRNDGKEWGGIYALMKAAYGHVAAAWIVKLLMREEEAEDPFPRL